LSKRPKAAGIAFLSLMLIGTAPPGAVASTTAVPANETAAVVTLPQKVVLGYSTKGRPIVAKRSGNPSADAILLVVGQMHGDEPKGRAVVKAIRKSKISSTARFQIWTITTMNPDGAKKFTRANARKVDLNRNFSVRWKKSTKGLYYSGKRPRSEKETRAMMSFISRLNPDGIVSFHQHANTVFSVCNAKNRPWVQRTGALMKLPVDLGTNCKKEDKTYSGTMNDWFTTTFNGWFATVEQPASHMVTKSKIRRYARSSVQLAREQVK
jgi:protein MpaA